MHVCSRKSFIALCPIFKMKSSHAGTAGERQIMPYNLVCYGVPLRTKIRTIIFQSKSNISNSKSNISNSKSNILNSKSNI